MSNPLTSVLSPRERKKKFPRSRGERVRVRAFSEEIIVSLKR